MKTKKLQLIGAIGAILLSSSSFAQTNVFDDIIATSSNHTYLEAAILQEGLQGALQNPSANLTVFAPTDQAFTDLANALGTDINGLLALPNLDDILLYHVLGSTVPSSGVTNGLIAQPLSTTNTLKLTVTGGGNVFVNQAEVSGFDLNADNGVVHVLDAVVLPFETVADVAIDNGFSTLVTAVVTAELLPALTDPLASYTVFAPTNAAFDALATALGTDLNGLLALPNLADVLTYHVLGTEVPSSAVTNGLIAQPLSATNTLKLTVTGAGDVFVNHAEVTGFDVTAYNGVVHILDAVVLPIETVADVAIDNGFSTLVTAVVTAELLPVLTNPLAEFTVFAPTNAAFDDLAAALGTDLNGILALPELADILTYHVVAGTVMSTDLTDGPVATVNGTNIFVSLGAGVVINDANVTLADVSADNGVVHVLDKVLLPSFAGIEEGTANQVSLYPNPTEDQIFISGIGEGNYSVIDLNGKVLLNGTFSSNQAIDMSNFQSGTYLMKMDDASGRRTVRIIKK
jgi:uncharacterized surface protein with fasciclin (FAS1) repeats